jgi:lysophospholipase L1-like esterase
MRFKKALVNFSLAVASLLVTLVVVEVLAGVFFCPGAGQFVHTQQGFPAARGVRAFAEYDPVLGWRGRPGLQATFYDYCRCPTYQSTVTHNSRGYRDGEHDFARPEGKRRILVLGDSYTWGWGVDYPFPTLLQQKFDEAGSPVEVVNLGVIGYTTDQEMLLYAEEGVQYEPDLVIVGFCVNDYEENVENWTWGYARPRFKVEPDGSLSLTDEPAEVSEWKGGAPYTAVFDYWLADYSLTYRTLKRLFSQSAGDSEELPAESRELTLALLNALRQEVEQGGAEFAVMMIPEPQQVVAPAAVEPDWYTLVTGWCADTGTLVLEPLAEMRARHEAGDKLYFLPHDPHWTQEGHRVVADFLFDQLQGAPDPARSDSVP